MEHANKQTGGTRYRTIKTQIPAGTFQSLEQRLSAPKAEIQQKKSIKGWLKTLPKMKDPSQKRAGRNIAMFFLLMLVLTLIARGTAAATVAQVQVTNATSDEIIEMIRESGTIVAGDIAGLKTPEGLTVEAVPALAGAAVKTGDQLVKFESGEVTDALQREQAKQKEYTQKLQELAQETPTDDTALTGAQNTLAWAKQDYQDTQTKNSKDLAAAQSNLDAANARLTAAQNALADLEQQAARAAAASASTLPEAQSDMEATPAPPQAQGPTAEEIAAAAQAVSTAQDTVESAKTALDSAKTQADEALKNAARAITNAEISLQSAEAAAAGRSQTANNQKSQNEISAEALRLDLKAQTDKVAALQKLADTGGWLVAEKDGVLRTVPNTGDKTDGGILVTYADTQGGYETEITVSKKEAQSVSAGAKAEIVDASASVYFRQPIQGTVKAIGQPDDAGKVKITISLPGNDWKLGQSLEVRLIKKQEAYQSCVPLSAVRSDSAGNFVLITEVRSTILGQESVLVKVPVTILSQSDTACAIEGALPMDAQIVTESTKPVAENDRVRVDTQ